MDRYTWLKQMRREAEEKYDTLWAPEYGEKWGLYANETDQQFIQKFLSFLPAQSTILDAACGAGRYMPMLLMKNHKVIGIDQSAGMLSRVKEKFPNVQAGKIGLQEMAFSEAFNGTICMDAMEHVFPEDWPLVLSNFQRALKPGGYLYFTVEIVPQDEVDEAFERGKGLGLPLVHGEWPDEDVYHYYPSMGQVREWIPQAGLELTGEGEGDGYHHFLVHKALSESWDDIKTQ
jgi:SAM-dependent methyltransferase